MTKTVQTLALVFSFALVSTAMAASQDKPPAPEAVTKAGPQTPLKIQVVVSRFQGEKKISSFPYTLSISGTSGPANSLVGRANLRMGAKIPVTMTMFPAADGKASVNSYQYQDVGTNIDCSAWTTDDGRFRLEITIDDSSVYPDEKDTPGVAKGTPSFRSFRASDSILLRDGGTGQFTTATDKVSGETVRVDVTLTVVK